MIKEHDNIMRALMGWQFIRERHGSLYDRGASDSYYGREPNPHYGGVGGDSGQRINVLYPEAIREYMEGYEDNEQSGNKKDYA